MIDRLIDDPELRTAARVASRFPALSPLDVLSLPAADHAIVVAAARVLHQDETRTKKR